MVPTLAAAQALWTGNTSNDWTDGTNWNVGVVPTGHIDLRVTAPNTTVLGVGGAAAGTTNQLYVARNSGNTGNLTIQNGSTLTTNAYARIGEWTGSTGVVTVTGAGTSWAINGSIALIVGNRGNGTLNIADGASVTANHASGYVMVGNTNTGTLNITSGGTLTSGGTAFFAAIGYGSGGTGVVTIDGAGSVWTISDPVFMVARAGNGTLDIRNGGAVVAQNGTLLAEFGAATGTLNLSSGGILDTLSLTAGAGTPQVNFNNGVLQARAGNAGFIAGFSGTELNIAAGGLEVDTRGFNVGTDTTSAFTGTGGLTKTGAGTFTLLSDSSYTGGTTITAGTLQLGNGGTTGFITGDVVANGTLAFNRSDNVTFNGVISGGGTVRQIGAGTTALTGDSPAFGGTTFIGAGTLQFGDGGTTGSLGGNVTVGGTLAFNRSNALTFGGVISGTGTLRQIGAGLIELTADSSAFAGSTSVEAGILAVNGSLCGGMNVLAGAVLQGTGTVCDTSNFAGGTIAPGNSIGTLTVNGNYVGNGGLLEIETVLGGDTSPTDRLVVTGDTSGSASVRVINRGGVGAPTVEGIKIIDVGGASNGTFTLQGDYTFLGQQAVIAGAYAYLLQKNGVSTPTDGDWYLRSNSTTPTPTPPGEPPPPPSGPIFAPTVPVYESYARVMLSLNELPTMQQRIGHRFRSGLGAMASMGVADASAARFSPLWARVEGGHKNLNPVATARSTLDIDHYKFEGGADLVDVETGAGRWLVGVVGNYVEGNADVYSLFGDGRIRVTGGGVGGTVTWLGDGGFYFDGQGRASWYSGDLRSLAVGPIISGNDGFGYAFGAEVGHRLGMGGGWSITPQMQVNYSNVEYDDFTDRFNGRVTLRNGASLLGRGGFSINHQHSWRDAADQLVRSDVYGIANAYYEFMDGNATLVSDTSFGNAIDRLWGSIGAGGAFSWANDKYALYGEVSYKTSLNQTGDSYSYRGTAGLRVRW